MYFFSLLEDYNCHDFDLPLHTVMLCIGPDNLALPLVPDQRKNIPERLVKLQLCQNAIDTILTLGSARASLSDLTHKIRYGYGMSIVVLLLSYISQFEINNVIFY